MIEPPSNRLLKTLLDYRLCTKRDLRRCRRHVRRLARDLPAFDSVWIDALLQVRKLTPFQAKLLESDAPERLCVGPCVLLNRLGPSGRSGTYLARHRERDQRCTLKLIDSQPESIAVGLANLEQLVERLSGPVHPSIAAPTKALCDADQLIVMSRYVPGLHLGELLVRRGRFPAVVVSDIAAQLIDALAWLEERKCVHGNLQLANVRLTDQGVLVLVECGLRPAVSPELTIHAGLSPECCDGVAPELIGTSRRATSDSDIYALGCLLWQLLAGRPPFPAGEALTKLALHQTREIEDVREKAPDTPAALAEAIRTFTAHDPRGRPPSFRAIRDQWKHSRRSARRRLKQFRTMFNTGVSRIPTVASANESNRQLALLALLLVVLGAASLALQYDRGQMSSYVAKFSTRWEAAFTTPDANVNQGPDEGPIDIGPGVPLVEGIHEFQHLPAADSEGVIELSSNGPFLWEQLSGVGPLTIRGSEGYRPVIVSMGRSSSVVAEKVILENLHFVGAHHPNGNSDENPARHTPRSSEAMLDVRSQDLFVRDCSFRATQSRGLQAEPVSALAWQTFDATDQSGGRIDLRNCLFHSTQTVIAAGTVPRHVLAENCLVLGGHSFAQLSAPPKAGHKLRLSLRGLTLRSANSLLCVQQARNHHGPQGPIFISLEKSLIDLAPIHSALILASGANEPTDWRPRIEIIGDGHTLVSRNSRDVAWVDTTEGISGTLESKGVVIEGIIAGRYQFNGKLSARPSDAGLRSYDSPFDDETSPGVDPSRLPVLVRSGFLAN